MGMVNADITILTTKTTPAPTQADTRALRTGDIFIATGVNAYTSIAAINAYGRYHK
jgi:hypothetical protein